MKMLRVGKIIYEFNSWYHSRLVLTEFSNFWKFHKLFQNALSCFLKSFKRACWMGKAVKEVNNADRKYALRYLWMSLERFVDLFNFIAPHRVKNVQIQSCFWSLFSPNTGKYGSETIPRLGTFLQSAAHHIMRP